MSSYSQAIAAGATSRPVHLWRQQRNGEWTRFTVAASTAREYLRRGKPFRTESPFVDEVVPPTEPPVANPVPPELQPDGTAHRKPKSRARKARSAKAKTGAS